MKILIVDDDSRIRNLFRLWLERAGFEVYEAEDGRKGVAMQRRNPVDLLTLIEAIKEWQQGTDVQ